MKKIKKKQLSVEMDAELYEFIDELASRYDLTISKYIRAHFKRLKKKMGIKNG